MTNASRRSAAAAPTDDGVPAGKATSKKTRAARRLVGELARHHFGETAERVVERVGGLTNSVFEIEVSQGAFVVRTHEEPTKINDYLKERWAMDAARAAGVPTPRVLEVGNAGNGRPYMILESVPGVEGRAARKRLEVVESLGRAAALLHEVPTRGFGPVFDWSSNTLSRHESWSQWLADGFGAERRVAILLKHRMIDAGRAGRLRRRAAEMSRWRKRPVLQHGDLRLKNAIVDPESGRLLALLDWDNCISSPAPFWDLSLALHDLGVDEKEAFLAGYGMKPRAFAAVLPYLRAFNVLNYAHHVESAVRKNRADRLERYRLRLQGGLDLYDV
jgi:aminoglycoside phosphotransferase (APT) family kinase protein